jgi:RNA polymerase sigma factor (sigma-70 family)
MTARAAALRRVIRSAVPAGEPVGDAELLRRYARDKDEAAFAMVVRRHTPMVLGVCRRVLPTAQDAEDACQAVFLILARKAGSVAWRSSAAGWLYAVARKVAGNARLAARRRARREAAAAVPDAVQPVDRMTGRELLAALDAELDRLPPRYRDPLVLCFLQGLTRDEAAAQLAVPVATLHTRIERGRMRLAAGLIRHGITLGAGLLAGVAATGTATAQITDAILAAVRDRPTKTVVDLARTVGPHGVGIKLTTLAVVAAVAALLGVAAMSPPGGPPPDKTMPAKQTRPPAPAEKDKPAGDAKAVEVTGRVVGPDGRPIAAASVSAWSRAAKKVAPLARTKTDEDGQFRITIPQSGGQPAITVVATADGFGPDWQDVTGSTHRVTLRVPADDVPIRGRFLNLEGHGIAGVTVRVRRVEKRIDGGDLDAVVATKRKWARGEYVNGPDLAKLPAVFVPGLTATTDADGRFRLTGVGRERIVSLAIQGKGIEPVDVEAFTRTKSIGRLVSGNENNAVYGATFERLLPPSKPIVGTVREKGTGRPLTGILVACDWLGAQTDADGRYRIDGLRKREQYSVSAYGVPYFQVTKPDVADTPGFEPVTVDFELERGIEVRGRVRDKVTGKPVRGTITYLAFADNPHLRRFATPGLGGTVRDDGSFSFTGLPGPGVLAVIADEDDYQKVRPAADWKLEPGINWVPGLAHAFVRVDVPEKDGKSAPLEIRLEPAATVKVEVVGPDGKPPPAYFAAGLTASARHNVSWVTQQTARSIAVRGMEKDKPRAVVVLTADGKLGGAREVRAGAPGPTRLQLQPLSGLTGRVVGPDGRPRTGVQVRAALSHTDTEGSRIPVQFFITHGTWAAKLEPTAKVDADGKFRLDGLMPGLAYTLAVSDEADELARRDAVTPPAAGKTADIGDLRTK